jgi:hypothetical protein
MERPGLNLRPGRSDPARAMSAPPGSLSIAEKEFFGAEQLRAEIV